MTRCPSIDASILRYSRLRVAATADVYSSQHVEKAVTNNRASRVMGHTRDTTVKEATTTAWTTVRYVHSLSSSWIDSPTDDLIPRWLDWRRNIRQGVLFLSPMGALSDLWVLHRLVSVDVGVRRHVFVHSRPRVLSVPVVAMQLLPTGGRVLWRRHPFLFHVHKHRVVDLVLGGVLSVGRRFHLV